jgi:hypothetical protein
MRSGLWDTIPRMKISFTWFRPNCGSIWLLPFAYEQLWSRHPGHQIFLISWGEMMIRLEDVNAWTRSERWRRNPQLKYSLYFDLDGFMRRIESRWAGKAHSLQISEACCEGVRIFGFSDHHGLGME